MTAVLSHLEVPTVTPNVAFFSLSCCGGVKDATFRFLFCSRDSLEYHAATGLAGSRVEALVAT